MRTTGNLGLRVWNDPQDEFEPADLEYNWDKLDADYLRGRPANQAENLAAVPGSGNFQGRLVYLTAATGGFPANTLIRYDGSAWAAIGYEILSSLPVTGNFPGRLVMLSATVSGFAQWSLVRYDGSGWGQPNKGVDISATVPVTNNYAGRLVVLSAADSGFGAWDVIRFNGSTWAKIGSGGETNYYTVSSDLATTNSVLPGDTINAFSATGLENVKHYFEIDIPLFKHSVTNGQTRILLRETGSTVVAEIPVYGSSTAGSPISGLHYKLPFTPTAASHTYSITWYVITAGTATILTTGLAPAVFRIFRA